MAECQDLLDANGVPVHLNTEIVRVERQGTFVTEVIARQGGHIFELTGDHFINPMPSLTLVHWLDPPPPPEVLKAARGLRYRDFPIVSLVIDQPDLFPDHWLYIHSPEFKVGRIQNFKDWNPARVTDAAKTCLGMEYFCGEGDDLWAMTDSKLIALASQEIVRLDLGMRTSDIEDGYVIRQYKAYPSHDGEYRGHLEALQDYIETFENLQTVGHNGMHSYNN
jgi:protoporphyrinogen oxidase